MFRDQTQALKCIHRLEAGSDFGNSRRKYGKIFSLFSETKDSLGMEKTVSYRKIFTQRGIMQNTFIIKAGSGNLNQN